MHGITEYLDWLSGERALVARGPQRYLPNARPVAFIVAACVLLLAAHCGVVHADVSFERVEIKLDRAADCVLADDIDRDGDIDIVLIRRSETPDAAHEAVVIRQQPTGRFANDDRQTFPLNSTSGIYDLADVAAGESLELLQLTSSGLRYYAVKGNRFDTASIALIKPILAPDLPPVAAPRHWDCAWPIFSGEKSAVVLPYLDHLDLWRPGKNESYTAAGTIPCAMSGGTAENGSGYELVLPELRAYTALTAQELFFEAGDHWHGVRRATPGDTEFSSSLSFDADPASTGQLLGIAPEFRAGCLMQDLNSDGSPDVVRWTNLGGINAASCEIKMYFGPFNESLPDHPHAQVSIKGVYGYPRFGDLNGDGLLDMLVCALETGSLSTAKMFVMKRLSLHLLAYRQRADNSFSVVADHKESSDYRLDLDVADPVGGPILTFAGDLDADGYDDFAVQTGANRLEIYRGHAEDLIDEDSPQRLDCHEAEMISSIDVDGDGRLDLLLRQAGIDGSCTITALLAR